ncbi:MAG: thioredoxin fold domain-containing protein [Proteobacteria bacterium]|nr:thioredoxin fold domain-containing protein [Pseudomonadota bacterium]
MTMGLFTIFSAGLLTFLTPCVLPLVPIYLSALIGTDINSLNGKQKGQLIVRALFFSIGFISVFTLLGLGASSIGAVLGDNRVLFQLVGAAIVLVFALKFLGVIRIPLFDKIAKADDSRFATRFAWVNALVMGIVFAAGWSPCVGPVLGSVLTYTATATSSPIEGAGYLTIYGLGFAIPLIITAAFAQAATGLMSKISRHLPKIERVTGILLLAVAAHLAIGVYEEIHMSGNGETKPLTAILEEQTQTEQKHVLPAMVEMYSQNCPVCDRMKPIVDDIFNQCDQRGVKVATLDVSDEKYMHLIGKYRLVGAPTFLFIDKDGNEVARLVGEQTQGTLKQALSALRGERCPGLDLIQEIDNDRTTLDFPNQNKKEVFACRSTTTSATNAAKNSKSSKVLVTKRKQNAPNAMSRQESCYQSLQ